MLPQTRSERKILPYKHSLGLDQRTAFTRKPENVFTSKKDRPVPAERPMKFQEDTDPAEAKQLLHKVGAVDHSGTLSEAREIQGRILRLKTSVKH